MTERDSSKIWVGQSGDCGNSPQRKPTNSNIPRKKLCRTESWHEIQQVATVWNLSKPRYQFHMPHCLQN